MAQDRSGGKGQVWQCVGNVLRSHAAAVAAFRQQVPEGKISMALNSDWAEPLTSSPADKVCGVAPCAAHRIHGSRAPHPARTRPSCSRRAVCCAHLCALLVSRLASPYADSPCCAVSAVQTWLARISCLPRPSQYADLPCFLPSAGCCRAPDGCAFVDDLVALQPSLCELL